MKRNYRILIIILAIVIPIAGFAIFEFSSQSKAQSDSEKTELYTCPMHPQIISKEPGNCPICGMNLVEKETISSKSSGGEHKILYWVSSMDLSYIRNEPGKDTMGMDLVPVYEDQVSGENGISVDPSIVRSIGVRYATVKRGPLELSIKAPAHVDYDEDHLAVLSTRTGGYIEKLYVTSPGATVKRGDPLFDFYSPKLYSAQEEYLIALRSGDSHLAEAARVRLKLLGVDDSQINGIRAKGGSQALTITAPMDGTVVAMGGSGGGPSAGPGSLATSGGMGGGGQVSSGGGMGGMGRGGASAGGSSNSGGIGAGMASGSGGSLREGSFVAEGSPVFTIADLSTVWVYAHIYVDQLQFVQVGMPANLELDSLPGRTFEGKVDFVYPYLEKLTRDIRLRISFPNTDGQLLPEMYGKVALKSRIADDTLIIPEEAVIFSGDHRVVFLSLPENKFKPIEIVVGPSDGNGNVQVLSGLEEGQAIVTSAQFMLDSESRMQEAINKMLSGQDEGANSGTEENVK